MPLRWIVRIRHGACSCPVLRFPLIRTGRALGQFPLVAEERVEVPVAPLCWIRGPCAFQTAGDRVGAFAAAESVFPAEPLLLNGSALGFGADIFACIGSAVSFAESVPARNERNGLLVIHRHAREGFA